jgi:hypothetical protein
MLGFISETLGATWWSILMFVAGALIGTPLFKWLSSKAPWNK